MRIFDIHILLTKKYMVSLGLFCANCDEPFSFPYFILGKTGNVNNAAPPKGLSTKMPAD